jgi:hypothetical protein
MKARFCYWTLAPGEEAQEAEQMIASARALGVFHQFHVWTDQSVQDAICHELGELNKSGGMFKLAYLRDAASQLGYEYVIWLEPTARLAHFPGDPLRILQGSPVHVPLLVDLTARERALDQWCGCPVHEFIALMRACGVKHRRIYSADPSFFIVHREAIDTLFNLTFEFWEHCTKAGRRFTVAPLFAYAMHMLCGNPQLHVHVPISQ